MLAHNFKAIFLQKRQRSTTFRCHVTAANQSHTWSLCHVGENNTPGLRDMDAGQNFARILLGFIDENMLWT